MEAIYEFEVKDMPVTVAVDTNGESVHHRPRRSGEEDRPKPGDRGQVSLLRPEKARPRAGRSCRHWPEPGLAAPRAAPDFSRTRSQQGQVRRRDQAEQRPGQRTDQRGLTNSPMRPRSLLKRISGHRASSNCRLSTTWLSTSGLPTAASPSQSTPIKAGTGSQAAGDQAPLPTGIFARRKPSITATCPAMVPVKVELCPAASRAKPNRKLARAPPTSRSSRW